MTYSVEQTFTIDGVKIQAKSIEEALEKFEAMRNPKKESKK